jgi:ribosomal protein S27E
MHAQPIRSLGAPAADPPLIRTRHALVVCVVCSHHQTRSAGRERVTCPDCGSTAWRRPAGAETCR